MLTHPFAAGRRQPCTITGSSTGCCISGTLAQRLQAVTSQPHTQLQQPAPAWTTCRCRELRLSSRASWPVCPHCRPHSMRGPAQLARRPRHAPGWPLHRQSCQQRARWPPWRLQPSPPSARTSHHKPRCLLQQRRRTTRSPHCPPWQRQGVPHAPHAPPSAAQRAAHLQVGCSAAAPPPRGGPPRCALPASSCCPASRTGTGAGQALQTLVGAAAALAPQPGTTAARLAPQAVAAAAGLLRQQGNRRFRGKPGIAASSSTRRRSLSRGSGRRPRSAACRRPRSALNSRRQRRLPPAGRGRGH